MTTNPASNWETADVLRARQEIAEEAALFHSDRKAWNKRQRTRLGCGGAVMLVHYDHMKRWKDKDGNYAYLLGWDGVPLVVLNIKEACSYYVPEDEPLKRIAPLYGERYYEDKTFIPRTRTLQELMESYVAINTTLADGDNTFLHQILELVRTHPATQPMQYHDVATDTWHDMGTGPYPSIKPDTGAPGWRRRPV